jgi:Ni/Fe-hydrogenase b-type cytochrome subunit
VVAAVLTQTNVWIDVIFTTIYPIMLIALAGHFLGNVLTGRAYRRFVKWEWPQHEGGPVPAAPKVMHFEHVAAMILLALSGMYIRFPQFGARSALQWIHYVAMIVVIINLIMRLWYAFASNRRDWREFAITKRDITTMPKVVMYYIFIKPSKPHLGKYNVMQKSTYILFVPLLIVQAITGLVLLTQPIPGLGLSPREIMLGYTVAPLVGGVAAAGAWARTLHYLINWLFIVLTTIHVYLSVTEDFPAFLDFFGLGGGHHDEEHEADAHGAPLPVPQAEPAPLVMQAPAAMPAAAPAAVAVAAIPTVAAPAVAGGPAMAPAPMAAAAPPMPTVPGQPMPVAPGQQMPTPPAAQMAPPSAPAQE